MMLPDPRLVNEDKPVELVTVPLSPEQYGRAVEAAVEALRAAGVEDVLVAYGLGCRCPDELLYRDVPLPLGRLLPYIAKAEAAGLYHLGSGDLHVNDAAGRAELLLCHEEDVHLISEDKALVRRLMAAWEAEGLSCKLAEPAAPRAEARRTGP